VTSLDVGDLRGDGWAEIVFGSTDKNVRVVDTRKYSKEVSADSYYKLAEKAYTSKDYNLTVHYSVKAEELYDSLGKENDVLKVRGLKEKASGYSDGDRYYNISLHYFELREYGRSIENADLAIEEYRKVNDLRKLTEASDLKKKAELVPNAELNLNLSRQYLGGRMYANASDYALKARSAYSYLENSTLEYEADRIYVTSGLYMEFHGYLDTAYNYTLMGNYGNATYYLSLARKTYDKLNDTQLEPQLENVTGMAESIKRGEDILVYGGVGVAALILLLAFALVVLFGMYFLKKGGFVTLSDVLSHYGLWLTELRLWINDSLKRRPRAERDGRGLRGLRGTSGESIGEYFKR